MLSRLNDGHLGGLAEVEIIDIYQHTGRAWQDQIIGVPALIQERPAPPCQLSGDLSDETWILQALGLGASGAATVATEDEP